jgi:hypothetical protein
MMHN